MLTFLRKKRWNHSNQTYMIYDLAILYIHMPAMTGFQLYREMKKVDSAITACFSFCF
jgi:DNA-binding response OmpR family regulator